MVPNGMQMAQMGQHVYQGGYVSEQEGMAQPHLRMGDHLSSV